MLYYKNENNEIFAYERAEEAPQGMVEIETPIFDGKVLPRHKALEYDEEGTLLNTDVVALLEAEAITNEQTTFRAERNRLLDEVVDHYQKPLVWESLTAEKQEEVRIYRQALLDSTIDWVLPEPIQG